MTKSTDLRLGISTWSSNETSIDPKKVTKQEIYNSLSLNEKFYYYYYYIGCRSYCRHYYYLSLVVDT